MFFRGQFNYGIALYFMGTDCPASTLEDKSINGTDRFVVQMEYHVKTGKPKEKEDMYRKNNKSGFHANYDCEFRKETLYTMSVEEAARVLVERTDQN